jgi:nitroreductase/NAD-dependent dihydropyrimidine dehydrogenase PreA subunit
MSLFNVDREKCKKDAICVNVCPVGLIELKDDSAVPTPVYDAEDLCISCGHCVAVCPHGALSHRAMTPVQCIPILKELQPAQEQVAQFLRSRRSIRVYQDKAVDRKTLSKLADIARFAPSGINSQPVEWLIIYDRDEVQRMAGFVIDWMRAMLKDRPQFAAALHMERTVKRWENGSDTICRRAPHIFVAHARKDNPMAASSCSIALAYLELAAYACGLGACWAGYFDAAARFWPAMRKELGFSEGHVSYGAMMLGYPKYSYYRIPQRAEARITWR